MSLVVSWIFVFCISIICAKTFWSLYVILFNETKPKYAQRPIRKQKENENISDHRTTNYRTNKYRPISSPSYIPGAVALKEDISYTSYEQYRKNNKIAR